jgi:hypothetical protein
MQPSYHDEEVSERPLGALFRQLSQDLGALLRQEAELAKAEIGAKASELGTAMGVLGAGALISLAGFFCLLLSAVLAVSVVVGSLIFGSLSVGILTLGIGFALLAAGRRRFSVSELKPTRAIDSLRKDAELVTDSLPRAETH